MPPLTGAAHSVLYKYSQIIPNTSSVTQKERNSEAVEATTPVSVRTSVTCAYHPALSSLCTVAVTSLRPTADGDGYGCDGRHLQGPDPGSIRRDRRSALRGVAARLALRLRREAAAGGGVGREAVRVLAEGRVGLEELTDLPRSERQHGKGIRKMQKNSVFSRWPFHFSPLILQ
jgi:hypothetical protein